MYLLLGLCVLSVVITKSLKFFRGHPLLDFYYGAKHRLRRNVVSYVLELLVTTVIFFVFAVVGYPLLLVDPRTPMAAHASSVELLVFFGLWLVSLYLWELVRWPIRAFFVLTRRAQAGKLQINWQLALHHVVTLFLVCACGYVLALTAAWCNVFGLVILVTTAVTEQPSFVALLLYRMGLFRHARNCFYVAGIASVVIKTACVAGMVPVFITSVADMRGLADVTFWLYAFWPLVAALYFSQMYGAVILFRLARVSQRRHAAECEACATGVGPAAAPPALATELSGGQRLRDLAQSALSRGATDVELDVTT